MTGKSILTGPVARNVGSATRFLVRYAHWLALLAGGLFLIPKRGDGPIFMVVILHSFAWVLALLMLRARTLSFRLVCYAVGLTAGLELSLFFQDVIHPVLMKLKAYPEWFGRGVAPQQSAQYARVFVAWLVTLSLFVLVLVKRTRTMDRLFVCLIAISVLFTALLFHFVTVSGVRESIRMQAVTLRMVAEAPSEAFLPLCREIGAICIEGDERTVQISSGTGNGQLDARLSDLHAQMGKTPQRFTNILSDSAVLAGNADRMTTVHVAYHHEPDGRFRMVVEHKMFYALLEQWVFLFAVLALAAHGAWIFGGLFLVFWHKSRAAGRVNNAG